MKKIKQTIFFIVLTALIVGCNNEQQKNNELLGLWEVEKMTMGENSMTPISRWTKFNSDSTLVSGNGWFQHSIGTWSLKDNQITIKSTNGVLDEAEPFSFSFMNDKMIWKRNEEGQEVTVHLKRIEKIPTSEGNKLLGLWKLIKSTNDGNDITVMSNPDSKAMLHIRWDNMYVQHNLPKGKQYGVYKIHGHKPEIQLVNYGESSTFSFWKFSISGKNLTLTSTNGKSVMEFERIHQFIK
ncbi:MAG: hypothetical protein JXR05_12775 [Flavobacteriaceae bacterium]